MDTDNNYTNRIERYLDGEMQSEELDQFEYQLQIDADLKQEFELYQLANQIIIQKKLVGVEQTIQQLSGEYKTTQKKARTQKIVLAIVIGLGLVTGLVYYFTSTNDIEELNNKSKQKMQQQEKDILVKPVVETIKRQVPKTDSVTKGNSPASVTIKDKPANIEKQPIVKPKEEKKEGLSQEVPEKAKLAPEVTVNSHSTSQAPPAITPSTLQTDPCKAVNITFTTSVKKPCRSEANGEVVIANVTGGKSPYKYTTTSGRVSSIGKFYELEKGVLKLKVIDANSCATKTDEIVISEQFCKLDLYLDPASNTPIQFPNYEKAGELVIIDKRGSTKFTTSIEPEQTYEWFGNSDEGNLTAGYYLFTIKYEDGTVQNGSITITP